MPRKKSDHVETKQRQDEVLPPLRGAGISGAVAPASEGHRAAARMPQGQRASRRETSAAVANLNANAMHDAPQIAARMAELQRNMRATDPALRDEDFAAQDMGPGGAPANEEGVIEDRPPETLPDVIRRALYDPNTGGDAPAVGEVRWYPLPAHSNAQRELALRVFRSIPCFGELANGVDQRGEAPLQALNDLTVVTNIMNGAMNSNAEVDAVANWVRNNGIVADAFAVQFPELFQDIQWSVMLAVSEDETFLLVEEAQEDNGRGAYGAPTEARYVYRWPGGRGVYLDNPRAAHALADLTGHAPEPAPAAAIDHVQPEEAVRNDAVEDAIPMLNAPAAPAETESSEPEAPDSKGLAETASKKGCAARQQAKPAAAKPSVSDKPSKLPAPPKRVGGGLAFLRASGFRPVATADGVPAMRKDIDDDRYVVICDVQKRSLALAKAYDIGMYEGDAETPVSEGQADGPEAVLDWIETSAPAFRP